MFINVGSTWVLAILSYRKVMDLGLKTMDLGYGTMDFHRTTPNGTMDFHRTTPNRNY